MGEQQSNCLNGAIAEWSVFFLGIGNRVIDNGNLDLFRLSGSLSSI